MKTIDQIKKELDEKRGLNSTLRTTLETEKRQMNDEELSSFETREKEISDLEKEMRTALASLRLNAAPAGGELGDGQEKELRNFSIQKAISAVTDKRSVEGFESEMQEEAKNEFREANAGISPKSGSVLIPMSVLRAIYAKKEKRDVTAGTGTAGGFNIETTLNGYVAALTEKSRILTLGTGYMTGAVGNIEYSQENAIFEPAFYTENGAASESSPTYTKLTLSPKRCAGFIEVSNQWLIQTSPDYQNRLWNQMRDGYARVIDKVGILGGGSNEPIGIMSTTGVGRFYAGAGIDNTTNANGAAPVWQDALNAFKVLGNSKGLTDESAHLMTYDLAAKLMNTKKDAGSGEFVWDEKMINGFRAAASTHVKNDFTKGSGTALSAWIFGSFAASEFHQWGGLELFLNPYSKDTEGLTRVNIAGYMDFAVYTPGSFAYGKDFITS